MINMYENLQEILENEIGKITKKGEIDQTDLCNLDKLVDVILDIHKISEYQDKDYSGNNRMNYTNEYSGRRGYMMDNSGYSTYYDNGMRNNDGYIRYEGDMRYSGKGSKDHMLSLMKQAMENATSQEEHDEIMKMVKKMEQ